MNFTEKTPESSPEQKYSIQKLSPYIDKFLKVLQIDLGRLHQHRLNIEKYSRLDDLYSLNKEQVNAGRTVQQIKANIKELEKARSRIVEEDLTKFDAKLRHVKEKALTAITEYIDDGRSAEDDDDDAEVCDNLMLCKGMALPLTLSHHQQQQQQQHQQQQHQQQQQQQCYRDVDYLCHEDEEEFVPRSLPVELERGSNIPQLQVYNVPHHSQAAQSWQSLKENLVDLNQMVHEFSSLVENQQEKIDQIEENLETAHENIQTGTKQLSKGVKIKAAMIPVAGALVGGIVGGPLGFVAGAKLGGVAAAVGGGLLGFVGGKFLKRRQQSVAELELSNLSKKGTAL
ncbi:syntaxin-17-like isoform X1 [Argonauta hians]